MDMGNLLADGGVVLRGGASSKRQALHRIAELGAQVLGLPESRVLEALLEREALGSTGLGSGVGVPHARIEGLDTVTGVFMRLDAPVSYGAVDDQPVDLLFALFAPPKAGAEHLRALAAVSRALRSAETREQLRQARTPDAVRALFVKTAEPTAA